MQDVACLQIRSLAAAPPAPAGDETDASTSALRSDYEKLMNKSADYSADRNGLVKLLRVVNDTQGARETTRRRIYDLVERAQAGPAGGEQQFREIVFEDTIFLKHALKDIEDKMNMSYEGESKSDPAIHWMILSNETTILVVRSANKYYYWTVSSAAGPPARQRSLLCRLRARARLPEPAEVAGAPGPVF